MGQMLQVFQSQNPNLQTVIEDVMKYFNGYLNNHPGFIVAKVETSHSFNNGINTYILSIIFDLPIVDVKTTN